VSPPHRRTLWWRRQSVQRSPRIGSLLQTRTDVRLHRGQVTRRRTAAALHQSEKSASGGVPDCLWHDNDQHGQSHPLPTLGGVLGGNGSLTRKYVVRMRGRKVHQSGIVHGVRLRSGPAWDRCRAVVLARDTHCWLCGGFVDRTLPPRHRMSASVDHLVPLRQLRGLPLAEARRIATDPSQCRLAHYGHNASRGAGRRSRTRTRRRPPQW